jgi:cytoskeletal protein RodZ
MPSAGKLLQTERLARDISLSALAAETCISTRYLQAIEDDNVKVLPGDFFHRSFIKQCAQALHLDQKTTHSILAAIEPAADVDPVPALTQAYQTAKREGRSSGLYRPSTRAAILLLAAVLIGCSAVYAAWHKSEARVEAGAVEIAPAPGS